MGLDFHMSYKIPHCESTVKMAGVYKRIAVKVADPHPLIFHRQHIVPSEHVVLQSVTEIALCHVSTLDAYA